MNVDSYRDYRQFLKDALENRMAVNSRYSLRAFSRDLLISPQMLSLVLNGKKGLSNRAALRIAERLGFSPLQTEHFSDLVLIGRAGADEEKKRAELRLNRRIKAGDFDSIEQRVFQTISDWHHYAILEIVETVDFQANAPFIARRLGIKTFEVEQALRRLEALKLLEKDANGIWKRSVTNLSAAYGAPNAALRKLAKQYLEKAIASLESQAVEERDLTNITMAIDPALLPEAKEMISEFRRKLCRFLESGTRSEVYVFAPSLFKITNTLKEI